MYATTHCALRNYVSESKCLHLETLLSWNSFFYETCCLWAPTSCDGVAPWASDFRSPHTMDTVERVHRLERANLQHCTWPWSQNLQVHWLKRANLQCNITTLYTESKPTSHGSHERESIVVFDKVPAQLVEQIPNFTQIQFNTLPLFFRTQFCTWHVQDRGKSVMPILHNFKTKIFQPQNAKNACIENVCNWLALPHQERGKARMPLGSGRLSRSMASIIAREV